MNSALAQRRKALKRANKVRSGWKDLKREIDSGELSVGEALSVSWAQGRTLCSLLEAQKGWGPVRAQKACKWMGFRDHSVRVRDLSRVQRAFVLRVFPAKGQEG